MIRMVWEPWKGQATTFAAPARQEPHFVVVYAFHLLFMTGYYISIQPYFFPFYSFYFSIYFCPLLTVEWYIENNIYAYAVLWLKYRIVVLLDLLFPISSSSFSPDILRDWVCMRWLTLNVLTSGLFPSFKNRLYL